MLYKQKGRQAAHGLNTQTRNASKVLLYTGPDDQNYKRKAACIKVETNFLFNPHFVGKRGSQGARDTLIYTPGYINMRKK